MRPATLAAPAGRVVAAILPTSPPPAVPGAAPLLERGRAGVKSRLAHRLLRLLGWRVMLAQPVPPKSVVVFYPHTSNWDFPVGLLAKWAMGIEFRWVGKHTLFATPLRRLFLRWGGVPVDRRDPAGFIDTLRAAFAAQPSFHLVITPEGTRRRAEHWKSGFYRLALAAGVPVGLAFLDRPRRIVGVGDWLTLSGDADADMARLARFYGEKGAWRPALAGPVRLRDQPRSPTRL